MRNIEPINIVGFSKFSRYEKISDESTYNLMVSDGALIPYPGYRKILDVAPTGTRGRASYTSPKYDHQIVVIDDGVYSISNDFARTFLGSLDTSTGSVFISENNANEIVITENTSNIYIFNYQAQTFNKVNIGFRAGYITFLDGYLITPELGTSRWRLSDLNNASNWPDDAAHVGLLQSQPDIVVSCETLQRQLFIFGRNVTEVWLDLPSPQLEFPFQRQNSISIEYGCVSPDTIASGFNRLCWLGRNEYSAPTILVSTGGAPQKIETDGIEFELDRLQNPENAFGFLFEEAGHIFYQIVFPSDNVSYAYDFTEGGFSNVTNKNLGEHIARKMSYFNDAHLFITDQDGGLYEMSTDLFTYKETTAEDDEGHTIPRSRITSPFRLPGSKRFVSNAASLTIEQGYTNKEMKVDLSLSKDGAQTFGNTWTKTLNKTGKRANKLIYRNLGAANDLTFQFRFWGKERFVITGGEMEMYA